MHSYFAKLFAAVFMLLACAAPLSAAIEVNDFIQLYNRLGSPGGVFEVDDLTYSDPTNPDTPNFYTFCVEVSEFISFAPNKYKVGSLGITTIASNKTITDYTAWLYKSFLLQTLTNFTFDYTTGNAGSSPDVNALQLAIWISVGWQLNDANNDGNISSSETEIDSYVSLSWINQYFDTLYSPLDPLLAKPWRPGGTGAGSFANSGWIAGDLDGVQVMNLLGLKNGYYTKPAQDQLIRIPREPPEGGPVPEAASLMIWSLLVSCGAMATGRRRS